ncbi:MAG: UDP-glucose--hexose-1-phosphate uridylyltransferase [Syntrophales bacterium]
MFSNRSHRRLNVLTGESILVSPNRDQRPWQGLRERIPEVNRPVYDPNCYLCPGNARAGGRVNPAYEGTFAFDNDFAALQPRLHRRPERYEYGLLSAEAEGGICRVVCFSPRHDLSLPELGVSEIDAVLAAWTDESAILGARDSIRYVQIFENKGEIMGCSNPHPHSQIWATEHIPTEPAKELLCQRQHFQTHGRPLLLDVLIQERTAGVRIVAENEHWTAMVPFWALWPFETLLIPRRPVSRLPELEAAERLALADLLKRLTTRYDNLFEISFPYSMGIHQAPFDEEEHPEWVLHLHFYPPLLRSATVRKFMVGYEMLGMPGRDMTAEQAAARLRECSEIHYKQRQDSSGRSECTFSSPAEPDSSGATSSTC